VLARTSGRENSYLLLNGLSSRPFVLQIQPNIARISFFLFSLCNARTFEYFFSIYEFLLITSKSDNYERESYDVLIDSKIIPTTRRLLPHCPIRNPESSWTDGKSTQRRLTWHSGSSQMLNGASSRCGALLAGAPQKRHVPPRDVSRSRLEVAHTPTSTPRSELCRSSTMACRVAGSAKAVMYFTLTRPHPSCRSTLTSSFSSQNT
jgi:hypothetical protein